jgi:hypothetical protein
MSAIDWQIAARPIALFVAIVLGTAGIICGGWLLFKAQKPPLFGFLLCAFGVFLLGLSLWQSFEIGNALIKINATLDKAEKATQDVKREVQAGNSEGAQKAAENAAKATSSASSQMRKVFGFH